MSKISFFTEDTSNYPGKSYGLARGLLARFDSCDLAQEGMGIGSVAVKSGNITYFASTSITKFITSGKILKTFLIDAQLLACYEGHPSLPLTLISEQLVDLYMKYPAIQKSFMACGTYLRQLLDINFRIKNVSAVGTASFLYEINESTVKIKCRVSWLGKKGGKVFILNELGADYFTKSLKNDSIVHPPSGWELLSAFTPIPSFYDEANDILFSINDFSTDTESPLRIFWGREKTPSLCWAGFEFELDILNGHSEDILLEYTVQLKRGRHEY